MTFRFVSNVDGTDISEARATSIRRETLFIVSSKTFTTLETLTNAGTARTGCPPRSAKAAVAKHFVAVSTNEEACRDVRHRPGQHVRLLGLGRRPLLGRLGDRPVADGRDRPRGLPRDARRLPRHGRALPHGAVRAEHAGADGPAGHLVRRLLRRARPRRSCRTASTSRVPRVPPAARHGVQRQVGGPGRDAPSTCRPARWCGARPARTASTPTTS